MNVYDPGKVKIFSNAILKSSELGAVVATVDLNSGKFTKAKIEAPGADDKNVLFTTAAFARIGTKRYLVKADNAGPNEFRFLEIDVK